MSVFRAVLFDLDGTLLDSFPGIHEAVSWAQRDLGIPEWNLATVKRHVGRGADWLMADATGCSPGETLARQALDLFEGYYAESCDEGSFVLPGVGRGLDLLRHAGLVMGIASNKPVVFSRRILDYVGLTPYFAAVLGPEDVVAPKPDPAMLLELVARLAVPREQTLYVGDMNIDIAAGRAAGIVTAIVPSGSNTLADLHSAAPDCMFPKFSKLVDWILGKSG